MQLGLSVSVTLHAAVIAVLWVGLPSFGEPMAPRESVPVAVVSTAEFEARTQPKAPESAPEPETAQAARANAAPSAPPDSAGDAAPAPPQPPPEPDGADAPPAPQSASGPEPASAGPPEVPKPRPKPEAQLARAEPAQPEPEPEPEPGGEPEAEPQAAETPEPERQQPARTQASGEEARDAPPRPESKPRVRLADDDASESEPADSADELTSILKDVESELSEAAAREADDATGDSDSEPEDTQQAARPDQPKPTPRAREQLSASQIANVRRQLQDCWRVPAGAKNAANLVVEIAVQLNRDGSVRNARIATTDRMNDSFYRAAAESALRAVQICSPLEGLPVDKYQTWQRMRLTFDPEEMFGS